jgi:hypothetical protein
MERRLNKKAESYVTTFKDDIREKATQLICSSPLNVDSQSPVFVFQSLTVRSLLPLANIVPSGLKATDRTLCFR